MASKKLKTERVAQINREIEQIKEQAGFVRQIWEGFCSLPWGERIIFLVLFGLVVSPIDLLPGAEFDDIVYTIGLTLEILKSAGLRSLVITRETQ